MADNKLAFIKSAFPEYVVQFLDHSTEAILVNPFYDENIKVYYYEDDDFSPFCVCFSFQHCHFTDEEYAIEWIRSIISGDKFAIEFFKDGKQRFGGDIDAKDLLDLSYHKLEQFTGYYGRTNLLSIADTFKVRGWNNRHNFDAMLIHEDNGNILIEKRSAR